MKSSPECEITLGSLKNGNRIDYCGHNVQNRISLRRAQLKVAGRNQTQRNFKKKKRKKRIENPVLSPASGLLMPAEGTVDYTEAK